MPTPSKQGLISDYGIDAICQDISDGLSMTSIAASLGVSFGTLNTWLSADPERSARVRETRIETAKLWDEKAVDGLKAAEDPFELARAKEIAFHFRWRSSKIDPRGYGDKIDLNHSGEMTLKGLPDDKVESRLTDLLGKAGVAGASGGKGAAQEPAED